MPDPISSRKHGEVKKIKKLGRKIYRDESGLFTVEGFKLLCEAIDAGLRLRELLFISSREEEKKMILSKCSYEVLSFKANEEVLNSIADTVTSQGILGVFEQLPDGYGQLLSQEVSLVVVADQVRDPGNMGAIIRIADAVGADGFVTTPGCVDLYNPKVVRAAAGSHFHLPICRGVEVTRLCDDLKSKGVRIFGLDPRGEVNYLEADLSGPVALVAGNEAFGFTSESISAFTGTVRIDMPGRAESLNVASAASVLLFEVLRQRGSRR